MQLVGQARGWAMPLQFLYVTLLSYNSCFSHYSRNKEFSIINAASLGKLFIAGK